MAPSRRRSKRELHRLLWPPGQDSSRRQPIDNRDASLLKSECAGAEIKGERPVAVNRMDWNLPVDALMRTCVVEVLDGCLDPVFDHQSHDQKHSVRNVSYMDISVSYVFHAVANLMGVFLWPAVSLVFFQAINRRHQLPAQTA
ncbi:MAG: hypothetical protein JW966_05770 [Anaerolineae bacterium]|nr:hypothetical protein [Anaerolineae bacterium]